MKTTRTQKILITVASFSFLVMLGGCKSSEEGGIEFTLESGDHEFTQEHGGVSRRYSVKVPESYETSTPISLVMNFHGGGGSASGHGINSHMDLMYDDAGFIVVYPWGTREDGLPNALFSRFWNPGDDPDGDPFHTNDLGLVDDVGFVTAMLDGLESKFNVDGDRVFATGLSNGGMLVHLLACELSDRIAAIAPVAGPFWHDPDACSPARPVPLMYFHGTADVPAPYDGGVSPPECSPENLNRNFISAEETVSVWVGKNACNTTPAQTYDNGDVTCDTYTACSAETEVTFCTIEGGGHTWPGGEDLPDLGECVIGDVTVEISANDAMWDFFQTHPM